MKVLYPCEFNRYLLSHFCSKHTRKWGTPKSYDTHGFPIKTVITQVQDRLKGYNNDSHRPSFWKEAEENYKIYLIQSVRYLRSCRKLILLIVSKELYWRNNVSALSTLKLRRGDWDTEHLFCRKYVWRGLCNIQIEKAGFIFIWLFSFHLLTWYV